MIERSSFGCSIQCSAVVLHKGLCNPGLIMGGWSFVCLHGHSQMLETTITMDADDAHDSHLLPLSSMISGAGETAFDNPWLPMDNRAVETISGGTRFFFRCDVGVASISFGLFADFQ